MKKKNLHSKTVNVLPFKTITIMASCSFFIRMNINKIKPKIKLIKSLIEFQYKTFESEHLLHQKESILQRTMKKTNKIK